MGPVEAIVAAAAMGRAWALRVDLDSVNGGEVAELSSGQGYLDWLGDVFVPIHRDGHKFLGLSLLATIVAFLIWSPLGTTKLGGGG